MKIAMLGSGVVACLYAKSLHSQRGKDFIYTIYSRNIDNAKRFADDYFLQHFTDDMEAAINHPEVEVVLICLPNYLHATAVAACAKAKKHVLCTKPLGRTAAEAKYMLDLVEEAGIFGGYLEDLCYATKFIKSSHNIKKGSIGRVLSTKSTQVHAGPHSDWFLNKEKAGGGAIIDLASNCVEIGRNFIGKDVKPIEVMCTASTQVYPIEAEDNAIGWVKYDNGAIAQFDVSWTSKAGMDFRNEVMGTEGTIWLNNQRAGFEMFSTEKFGNNDESADPNSGWLFPEGDSLHELGFTNMFTDMFNAIENKRPSLETFYDGYVVNAILDAAFLSAKTKQWQSVVLEDWRGQNIIAKKDKLVSFNADFYLIKEELLPNGDLNRILKNKISGEVEQHTW